MDHNRKQTRTLASSACALAAGVAFLCFAWLTRESEQLAFLGTLVCACAGYGVLELQELKKERRGWDSVLTALPVPFALTTEPLFFREYVKIVESLTKIVLHNDLLYRELSRSRMEMIADDVAILAKGQVVFHATETWRSAYQRVLETMRVKTYYSVAWVRTNDYWNDVPGRQSMRFNYELRSPIYSVPTRPN